MNDLIIRLKKLFKFLSSRSVATAFLAMFLAFSIYELSIMTKAVYITDATETYLKFTASSDAKDILVNEGIKTTDYDVVDASGFSGKVSYINVIRAFPVTLKCDGVTKQLMATGETVEELLLQNDVELSKSDLVNLPLDKVLEENDSVVVTRISEDIYEVSEVIEFSTIYKPTCLLKAGVTKTLKKGYDGLKVSTYKEIYVDGKLKETELISEEVTRDVCDSIVLEGELGAKISPLDFECELDENGVPKTYKTVLTNQVATGYSASPRAIGASGMKLSYGYVATDPADIPYGTKMYITSDDGSFVYGYAIAADTGIGLLDNVIDVDLYYETYLESCLNSRRNVSIYILE